MKENSKENKDETYPFAFLATYSIKDKNTSPNKSKHIPLKKRNEMVELFNG